jgi:uncharacterized phiE125 gp8 family phage protein
VFSIQARRVVRSARQASKHITGNPMKAFPRRAGPPAAEPLTLSEVLVHLRADADGGANDAYVTALISVARETCEARTERTLISTPLTLNLDAFPDAIELLQPPVIDVTALRYLDTDGVQQTVDLADTYLDKVSEPAWLVPAPDKTWPETLNRINAVTVEYTAGYGATGASVPAPLKHWMLLAIGEMYELRSGSSDKPAVRHDFADALLQPFRLLGV